MNRRCGAHLAWRVLVASFFSASCASHGGETTPHRARATNDKIGESQHPPPVSGSLSSATPVHAPSPEGLTVPSAFNCPEVLVSARKGGSAPDRYVAPTPDESAGMARLFAGLSRQGPAGLSSDAGALGFSLAQLSEQSDVWSLVEAPDRKRGAGAYLLRRPTSSKLIVQAPHTFFDEGTLPLACELFQRGKALALFIETAHRYKAAEATEAGNFPADLAHAKDSLFQAATQGLLTENPGATLVQLHGFAPRESGANVVVSSGIAAPSGLIDDVQRSLSSVVSGVLRFPAETSELGATTNVQGSLARSSGARFIHIEMSAPLRAQLLQNDGLRARFLDALVRGLGNQ